MYISGITLKGFVGIWSGTGRNEITINFPNPSETLSRIILLMGSNGSGKSTVLSHLHPFAESFDGRQESMIHGDEGEKIITIEYGGSTWVAHHIYIKKTIKEAIRTTTKSYLSKNGEELNDNGGVTTFKNLIHENFGLEESFFKVGRLSSTTTNFVSLPTGQRKDFIIQHLPDVSPYLDAFKEAKDKCSTSEKTIKYLGDELSKLGDKNLIIEKVDSLKRIVAKEEKVVSNLGKQEAVLKDKIKDFSQKDSVKEATRLTEENEGYETRLANGKKELTKLKKKYPEYDDFSLEDIKEEIEELLGKTGELKSQSENSDKNYEDESKRMSAIQQSISTKNRQLGEIERSKESIEELKILQKRVEKEKVIEETEQNKYLVVLDRKGITSSKTVLNLNLRSNERSKADSIVKSISEKVTTVMNLSTNPDFIDYLEAELEESNIVESEKETHIEIQEANNKILELEKEKIKLNRLAGTADLLNKRPVNCDIDECLFVVEGKRGKDAEKKLITLNKSIKECHEIISQGRSDLEFIEQIKLATNYMKVMYEEITSDSKLMKTILIGWKELSEVKSSLELLNLIAKMGELKFKTKLNIDTIFDYIESCETIKEKETTLESLRIKIKARNESETFIQSIEREIEKLVENLDSIRESVEEIRKQALTIEKKYNDKLELLKGLKEIVSYTEGIDKMKILINDNIDQIARYKEDVDKYNVILSELETIEENIKTADSALQINKKEFNTYTLRLTRFEEYTAEIEDFTEKYTKQLAVKDASDPKKGIPLIFMKTFLENIEDIANNLFDIAFKGKFRIQFIVTEKDFFIQVLKEDGEILNDVKFASDGEQALIKTMISLSLLSLYTDAWPVLACDEVDAVLDIKHRSHFAEIIEGQIKELELKQVFVISHNENFRDESISVILFPGNTLTEDENNLIIANFSGRDHEQELEEAS